VVGYARTSTAEQEAGLQAQVRDLQAAGCAKIFQEQVSSIAERAELERALDYVRAGDTLVVTKVDRLARSTVGLWEIVKRLEAVEDGGAGLRVLNLGGETVDTKSATGKLILTIFAGFAQFEREMMLERQREGIAKAKAENRYMGRRPTARLKADEAVKLFKEGRTVTEIAKSLNIGRGQRLSGTGSAIRKGSLKGHLTIRFYGPFETHGRPWTSCGYPSRRSLSRGQS